MDEIRRARKLTEEILARAASIKTHMAQVNQSMANMALVEAEGQRRLQAARGAAEGCNQPLGLMDLPDDLLRLIAAWCSRLAPAAPTTWHHPSTSTSSRACPSTSPSRLLTRSRTSPAAAYGSCISNSGHRGDSGSSSGFRSSVFNGSSSSRGHASRGCSGAACLASLAATCRRWRRLATREPQLWEGMCRRRWGISEADPASVLIVDPRRLHLHLHMAAAGGSAAPQQRAATTAGPLPGPRSVVAASAATSGSGGGSRTVYGVRSPAGAKAAATTAAAAAAPLAPVRSSPPPSRPHPPSAGVGGGGGGGGGGGSTAGPRGAQPSPPRAGVGSDVRRLPKQPASMSPLPPQTASSEHVQPQPSPSPPRRSTQQAAKTTADPTSDSAATTITSPTATAAESATATFQLPPKAATVASPLRSPGSPASASPSPSPRGATAPAKSAGVGHRHQGELGFLGSSIGPSGGPAMGAVGPLLAGGDALEPVPLGHVLQKLGLAEADSNGGGGGSSAGDRATMGAQCGGGGGSEGGDDCGGGGPNPWLLVYQDRAEGWRGVLSVFRWLQSHGCPAAVSGAHHRQQLLAALRHLGLALRLCGDSGDPATRVCDDTAMKTGTGLHEDPKPACSRHAAPTLQQAGQHLQQRQGQSDGGGGAWTGCGGGGFRDGGGLQPWLCSGGGGGGFRVAETLAAELLAVAPDLVPCLLSLLSNDGCLVVELAAGSLADLLALDEQRLAEASEAVAAAAAAGSGGGDGGSQRRRRDAPSIMQHVLLGSNSGRTIAAQLRDGVRSPGIVRQVTRCLVNLWASGPVPRVLPLRAAAAAAGSGAAGGSSDAGSEWGAAVPPLESGVWLLQEFSARGDCMRLIHTLLTFRPGVSATTASLPSSAAAAAAAAVAGAAAATSPRGHTVPPWAEQTSHNNDGNPAAGPLSISSGLRYSGAGTSAYHTLASSQTSPSVAAAITQAVSPAVAGTMLVGPDGRPLGGTAAALAALGGGTRQWRRGGGGGGGTEEDRLRPWERSGGGPEGGRRQVVELLGGGYDVMLPRGAMSGLGGPTAANAAPSNPASPGSFAATAAATTLDREAEEFRLSGWVDPCSGEWLLVRSCVNVPFALTYRGYSDSHGCWGTYTVQQQQQQQPGGGFEPGRQHGQQQGQGQGLVGAAGAAVSGGLSVRGPRVFRLFRDPSLPPPEDLVRLLAAMQEHPDPPPERQTQEQQQRLRQEQEQRLRQLRERQRQREQEDRLRQEKQQHRRRKQDGRPGGGEDEGSSDSGGGSEDGTDERGSASEEEEVVIGGNEDGGGNAAAGTKTNDAGGSRNGEGDATGKDSDEGHAGEEYTDLPHLEPLTHP